jgi:hypothetical protein
MYDVGEVLARIDAHTGVVVVLLLFGWIGGFVQIVEALRLGFTQRVAGQPIATTVIMLAHDATFSIGYDHWFHEVDHICFKLFWVGMVASNAIELVLLYHWVKFRDTSRGTQPPEWAVWTLVAVFGLFAFALWWWVQSLVSDPLDLMGLTVVQVGAVVFGVPMLLGRGTARGQSRVFAWATVLGPGSLGFLFIPYLSPKFAAHPAFFVLAGTTTACAIAFLLLYEHLRRADARLAAADAQTPVAVA